MRWDALFADLEAQFAALADADSDAEVRDRARREWAQVQLADRLHAAVGAEITIHALGQVSVSGRLTQLGADWLLVAETGRGEAVLPIRALAGVVGLGRATADPAAAPRIARKLKFGYVLRGLGRNRVAVSVITRDGATVHGTIDRVGADFVELAEHEPGEARRPAAVRAVRAVPLRAVAVVRSA